MVGLVSVIRAQPADVGSAGEGAGPRLSGSVMLGPENLSVMIGLAEWQVGPSMVKHSLPRVPTSREAWHSYRPRIYPSYNAGRYCALTAAAPISSRSFSPSPQVEAMHHALLGLADVFTSEIGESRADCPRHGLRNPVNRLRQRKRSVTDSLHLPP